jgi:hypothetical protein
MSEESQEGNLFASNHSYIGYKTTAKAALIIIIGKKGLKIRKVKINVLNKSPKKKYLSIILLCNIIGLYIKPRFVAIKVYLGIYGASKEKSSCFACIFMECTVVLNLWNLQL